MTVGLYRQFLCQRYPVAMRLNGLIAGLPRSHQQVIIAAISAEQRAIDEGRDADIPAIHAAAHAALPLAAVGEGLRAFRKKARAVARPEKPHLRVVPPPQSTVAAPAASASAGHTISRPTVSAAAQEHKPMKPRISAAAFLRNVRNIATRKGPVDPAFASSQATPGANVSQESNGADGGYLVPPEVRTAVASALQTELSLLSYCTQFFTKTNEVLFPADAGPYFSATPVPNVDPEGSQNKIAKAALAGRATRLGKIDVLLPVTDEIVEDAGVALDAWLSKVVSDRFTFRVNDMLINGNGAEGTPLGFLQSPCLITQLKESGQAAGTIVAANVAKLWGRLPAMNRARAVWICHPDAEPALLTMAAPNNAYGIPPVTYDENGMPRLMGRPVVVTEAAQALGTPGDLILADMASVLAGVRETSDGTGVKRDFSIHCWFDLGISAFRFSIRIGSVNVWATPVTRLRGGNTVSSCATLEAR